MDLDARFARVLGPVLRPGAQRHVVVAVFVLATALRLYFNLVVHPLGEHVYSDMRVYDHAADQFLARAPTAWDTFTPAGYPAFLAVVFRLAGGHRYQAVAVVQALLGGATCAVAHLLALRVTRSPRVALYASVVLIVYVPFILYGGYLLTEGPSALLVTSTALLLLRAGEEPRWTRLAAAGAVLGLTATVRPNLLLFYPFLLPWAWAASGRSFRGGALLSAKVMAFSLPVLLTVVAHNSRILGRPAGLGTNGGLNFYLSHAEVKEASCEDDDGVHRIGPIPNIVRYSAVFNAPVPFYEERFYYREGARLFVDDPWKLLSSLDNLVEGVGLGKQDFWPGWKDHERFLVVVTKAMFWLGILPMMLHALVLAALGRLSLPEETPRFLLVCFVLSSLATMYLFLGDPRVRVPFDALVLILSVDGWVRARGLLESFRHPDVSAGSAGRYETRSPAPATSDR